MGVDLYNYGRLEKLLLEQDLLEQNIKVCLWYRSKYGDCWLPERYMSCRLLNFTYGEAPEDWYIWISEVGDERVSEFWRMIEHAGKQMPGAWIEESENEGC